MSGRAYITNNRLYRAQDGIQIGSVGIANQAVQLLGVAIENNRIDVMNGSAFKIYEAIEHKVTLNGNTITPEHDAGVDMSCWNLF